MRPAVGSLVLVLAVFFAFVIQEFIPPIKTLHGARVLLVPMIFCYAAMVLPTWLMLLAAFYTGFVTDLNYLHVVDGQVEIGLGFSIVFFVLFGLLANGFQPAFRRGHWWLHIVLSAVGTSLFLLLQFAMISLRREGFVINELVAWRILGPGLVAALLSPVLHLIVVQASQFLPDDLHNLGGYRDER
jgi:cell shape-determining protein MreD